MKIKEIVDKSGEELKDELVKLKKEAFKDTFKDFLRKVLRKPLRKL